MTYQRRRVGQIDDVSFSTSFEGLSHMGKRGSYPSFQSDIIARLWNLEKQMRAVRTIPFEPVTRVLSADHEIGFVNIALLIISECH